MPTLTPSVTPPQKYRPQGPPKGERGGGKQVGWSVNRIIGHPARWGLETFRVGNTRKFKTHYAIPSSWKSTSTSENHPFLGSEVLIGCISAEPFSRGLKTLSTVRWAVSIGRPGILVAITSFLIPCFLGGGGGTVLRHDDILNPKTRAYGVRGETIPGDNVCRLPVGRERDPSGRGVPLPPSHPGGGVTLHVQKRRGPREGRALGGPWAKGEGLAGGGGLQRLLLLHRPDDVRGTPGAGEGGWCPPRVLSRGSLGIFVCSGIEAWSGHLATSAQKHATGGAINSRSDW